MQAIEGQPYTTRFDFFEEGEFFVPDAGTVSYTVYDNAGEVLGALSDQAIVTDSSTQHVNVGLPGSAHSLDPSKDFEQRSIRLKYQRDGVEGVYLRHYYVTPYLNYRVEPLEVFEAIGIKDGEVFLHMVDLVRSYMLLKSKLSGTVLVDALKSGGISQLRANEAIKYQAAVDLLTAIELKVLRKAGGDMLSFTRFEGLDFERIKQDVREKLAGALEGLQGEDAISYFTLSTPTDAITGA